MDNQFPIPITDETDLNYYESYLNREFSEITTPKPQLCAFLKAYIGKPVKIEIISNKTETRMGKLSQVGNDFLSLKAHNQTETIIPLTSVKVATVLQNNTKLPHF